MEGGPCARTREVVSNVSINRVNISGNLTRDPELRSTGGGTQVLSFGVAVNDRRRNQQTGEWEDVPNFVDCVVFGARAEPLSRYLSKGSKVAIEGKLRYSSWESKEGQRRSKLEVVVDEVEFLSPRNQGNAPQQAAPAPQYNAPQQVQPAPYAAAPQPSAPAQYPAQSGYSAPAPAAPPVSTPPAADVYDEDIPF
mgnify:CR=1 FL=1